MSSNSFSHVLALLPPPVRTALSHVPAETQSSIQEIRLSEARPVMVTVRDGDRFVTHRGLSRQSRTAIVADAPMVAGLLDVATHSSVYAVEESMREGFLTLPGGHRVGLVGSVRLKDGRIDGFRHVVGFNIRLNRPVIGVADPLLNSLIKPGGHIGSTLIVSPPGCGKTTLLRDLVRVLSYGDSSRGMAPLRVGVADERSEIAACHKGIPQNDLGPRADVIDQCPKRIALTLLLRAMGPDVLATDEIGHPDDAAALIDAAGAGVSVLCTTHGNSVDSLWQRPSLRYLMESQLFEWIVLLSRRKGPGTVERVVRASAQRVPQGRRAQ